MIVLVLLAQTLATPPGQREHARRIEVPGVENVGLVAPGIIRGSLPDAQAAALIAEELGFPSRRGCSSGMTQVILGS